MFSNGSSHKSSGELRVSSDSDDEMSPLSEVGHHLPTPEIPPDDVGRKNMFDEGDDDDEPSVTREEVYGHYRTSEYNKYAEWARENKKNY